jgi:hypothetical protein
LSGFSKLSKQVCLSLMTVFSLLTLSAAQKPTTSATPTSQAQPRPQPPQRRAGRATRATLTVAKVPRQAPCPVKLHFTGTITTDGATEVKYTWVSFDGGTWATSTLNFTGPGTQKVGQEWQLGGAGQTVHGWLQLKVTSPDSLVSTKAPFTVVCGGSARRK